MISLFVISTMLFGSNMTENNRYIISDNYSIPYEFNNSACTIDIYYMTNGTPSEYPYLQILRNDTHLVNHLLFDSRDFYMGNGGSYVNGDIYKYSFSLGSVYYTDSFDFYLVWDDYVAYTGANYYFDIVFNCDSITSGSYDVGFNEGYNIGLDNGYDQGYIVGFDEGVLYSDNNTLGQSLLSIADIPFKILNDFIGFEIFGFNIVTFLTGLLGIALIGFLIKLII